MKKKLLKYINKNIIIINLLIITLVFIFYIINKNKFNTYKAYLTYNFEERNWLFGNANLNFIDNYLSDLQFSSEKYITKNLKKNIKLRINKDDRNIIFSFNSKRYKFLNSDEYSNDENINLINNFIENSLNIYHRNLSEDFLIKKNFLNEPLLKFSLLDPSASSIEKMNNIMKDKFLLDEYLEILNDGGEIIKNQGYNIKYRRLFLNLEEYLISSLILLILFNFIVKNFRAIIN